MPEEPVKVPVESAAYVPIDIKTDLAKLSWHAIKKERSFTVSTDRGQLDLKYINGAFGTDEMSWARPMTDPELQKMVDNSLTFGVYVAKTTGSPSLSYEQIGMARLIADHVTFAYLTDVYISPEYRRYGLARWLMECVREVMAGMPAIRRGMLVTGLAYGAEFYKDTLGFHDVNEERDHLIALTGKFAKHEAVPDARQQGRSNAQHMSTHSDT